MNALLLSAKDKAIVHIDEAHELKREYQTALYLATDQAKLVVPSAAGAPPISLPLADFTLLLSTTDEYCLLQPLRDRMKLLLRFDFYSPEELTTVVVQRAKGLCWDVEETAFPMITALAKLGKDLAFNARFRVDADMEMHVAKRRRLAEADGRDDLRQFQRTHGSRRRLGCLGVRVTRGKRHGLKRSGTIAVDGDALAFQLVREKVRLLDILNGGISQEIDRLARGGVRVPLPSGLHADVPLRSNVARRAKHAFQLGWQVIPVMDGPMRRRVSDDCINLRLFFDVLTKCRRENRVDLDERLAIEHLPGKREREQGLDARRTTCDDRDGAGRGKRTFFLTEVLLMVCTLTRSFQQHFTVVEDPRIDRSKCHLLMDTLFLAMCATIVHVSADR